MRIRRKALPEVLEHHQIGRLRLAVNQKGVPIRRGKTAQRERVAHAPDRLVWRKREEGACHQLRRYPEQFDGRDHSDEGHDPKHDLT
jgi:hypothetical protein